MPDDIADANRFVAVPDTHALGLGRAQVFEFAQEQLREEYDRGASYFKSPGAYGKFKNLLERREMLEACYEHEAVGIQRALQRWLAQTSIAYTWERKR